jgi:hypothetical protein
MQEFSIGWALVLLAKNTPAAAGRAGVFDEGLLLRGA